MSLNRCPYCEHGNPADAKFCSACGGALHLVPCPRCGAVSDVTATVCYQCHGQLPGRGTDALDSVLPAAEVSRPVPRRRSRVIVGTAVLAAIGVLGYNSYRQRSPVDAPQPAAASSEASGRGSPAGAGVGRRDAAAGDTTPAKADDSARPASPATRLPETPLAGPTRAAANQPRADRQPVESRETKVTAAPIASPQVIDAGKAGRQKVSRPEACTESIASLGLCTPESVQMKEAETAAAGKAGVQELPRQEACTEAVAALGLCAPIPTQRRE